MASLRPPLAARRVVGLFEPREGIDRVWAGPGVVYCSRLAARASGSRMGLVTQTPEYRDMTIRSWRTTTRLASMMDE